MHRMKNMNIVSVSTVSLMDYRGDYENEHPWPQLANIKSSRVMEFDSWTTINLWYMKKFNFIGIELGVGVFFYPCARYRDIQRNDRVW